jgi:hypothetical protein
MRKSVQVDKAAFDSALSRLLQTKPTPSAKIKTAKKEPAKIIKPD